jgi:voltage-gated potassium channel
MTTYAETTWKYKTIQLLNLFGVLASVLLIVSISVEAFSNAAFTGDSVYNQIQFGVCIYFLLDFLLQFVIAQNRLRFFGRNFVLIILSIPYAFLLGYFSVDLSSEAFYVIHFLPIIRGGFALAILVKMAVNSFISGLLIIYLAIFIAIAYFQTLIFYAFEAGANPLVKAYPDVLWWASMTVTTVGSNIIPVTDVGKICTAVLAVVGMTTFPIFTAYITALVHGINDKHKAKTPPG